MGSSISSLSLKRQHGSTPSIGYGRGLRVADSPPRHAYENQYSLTPPARFIHAKADRVIRGGYTEHESTFSTAPFLPRSTSWHGAAATEHTALLVSTSDGDGTSMALPLQLSSHPYHNTRALKQHPHGSGSSMMDDDLLSSVAPPLAIWIVPALLCALAYALYNIFIKKGSASIHPVLGGVILQLVAAVLGIFLLLSIVVKDNGISELHYDYHGIQWAICAGIAVGLAEMISFFVSSLGVQAVQSIPIIIGGSVLFGTLLGLVLLAENLSLQGWLGVGMLICGICLVGTDPAATAVAE